MSRTPDSGNGFLAEIEDFLNQIMGQPNGSQALKSICERHKGSMVYIPGATEMYIAWRNRQIVNEFKGDNYEELALKWNLKTRRIRRIIHEKPNVDFKTRA